MRRGPGIRTPASVYPPLRGCVEAHPHEQVLERKVFLHGSFSHSLELVLSLHVLVRYLTQDMSTMLVTVASPSAQTTASILVP